MSLPAEYSNPQPDHAVNVGGSDGIEFRRVLGWSLGLLAALVLFVFLGARVLIPMTPYAWEERAFGALPMSFVSVQHADLARVSALLDRLSAVMGLPDGMKVKLAIVADPAPNAFATVGARIFVTEGLLAKVESENELAMVLAHELAHLAARDPAVSLGAGATLAVLGAAIGLGAEGVSQGATQVSTLAFSRAQERAADALALRALTRVYGHAGGADAFFRRIQAERSSLSAAIPGFLSTHPSDAGRIQRIEASQAGWDPLKQALVPWRASARVEAE